MNNRFVTGTLIGVDSNAFSLMGHFKKLALRQGFSREWVDSIIQDAMSGDYDRLLRVLDSHMREE